MQKEAKKLFKLDDNDFNRIVEISANLEPLVQIVDGQVRKYTNEERAMLFWQSIAVKYGFIPLGVETNIPMRTAQYFLAEPIELGKEKLFNWCRLCNGFSGPDTCGGCDRATEPGCAWFVGPKTYQSKKKEDGD
jgi:hypothetical protein